MYEINTSVKFSLKKKTCHENDALFHTTKYLTCSVFDWGVFMCAYSCGQNIQNSGNSFPVSLSLRQSQLKSCILLSKPRKT